MYVGEMGKLGKSSNAYLVLISPEYYYCRAHVTHIMTLKKGKT